MPPGSSSPSPRTRSPGRWALWPPPGTPWPVARPCAPSSSRLPPGPPAADATRSPGTCPRNGPGKTPGRAPSRPPTGRLQPRPPELTTRPPGPDRRPQTWTSWTPGQQEKHAHQRHLASPRSNQAQKRSLKFGRWIQAEWLRSATRGKEAATARNYADALRPVIERYGAKPLQKLTTQD